MDNEQIAASVENSKNAINEALRIFATEDFSWLNKYPANDDWAMSKNALCFVSTIIKILKPQHILEFGSGLSTFVISETVKKGNLNASISSIDHDPVFGSYSAKQYPELREQIERGKLSMQIAPLVAREYGSKFLPSYLIAMDHLASTKLVDFVIIDGPPASLGGREGTLYQVLEFSKGGTLVLLDDADRIEEQLAISCWKQNLGKAIEVIELPGFSRGMAAIIILEPLAKSELFVRKINLFIEDVNKIIPTGSKLSVIGEDWWSNAIMANYETFSYQDSGGFNNGPPLDDSSAISILIGLKSLTSFLVISESAFWWIEYYKEWYQYLRSNFICILENERLVIFDLNQNLQGNSRESVTV